MPSECSARHAGVEPATYGSGVRRHPKPLRGLLPTRPLRDRAVELLRKAHEVGEVPRADVEALARDWLALVGAEAALQVLTSSTHEATRIVAFLALVVELTEKAVQSVEGTEAKGDAR